MKPLAKAIDINRKKDKRTINGTLVVDGRAAWNGNGCNRDGDVVLHLQQLSVEPYELQYAVATTVAKYN